MWTELSTAIAGRLTLATILTLLLTPCLLVLGECAATRFARIGRWLAGRRRDPSAAA